MPTKYLFFMTSLPNPAVPRLLERGAYTEFLSAWSMPGNGNAPVYWMSAFLDRLQPKGF